VPPFTYTQLGNQTSIPVPSQGLTVWADGATKFFVPDTQPGERWFAPAAPRRLATSANMTVAYYHQYLVNVSLKVNGGGQPAQTLIAGTSGGQQIKELLGQS